MRPYLERAAATGHSQAAAIDVAGRNLCTLTADSLRVTIFHTKIHDRVLRPLLAVDLRLP